MRKEAFSVKPRQLLRRVLCMVGLCALLCGIFPMARAAELPEVRVKVTDEHGDLVKQSLHGGYLLAPSMQYRFQLACRPTAGLMVEVTFTHVTLAEGEAAAEENAVAGDTFVYDVPFKIISGVSCCEFADISVRQDTLVHLRLHFTDLEVVPAGDEYSVNDQLPLWEQIPTYYQNDYPDIRYGSGTLASNGCSAVSLAMVATYMTGHRYLPEEIARYIGILGGHNISRLEEGCKLLQIPCTKAENFNETFTALQEGKAAIVLVNEASSFTNSQHFMVLAGMNGDKIMVLDPNRSNQSAWEMAQGFQEGFSKKKILNGYSGGWIFDKAEMSEKPFIYTPPQPEYAVPRYPDIAPNDEETELMARLIWSEARSEPFEGQQAVAEVILNRFAIDQGANNIAQILHGEGQFHGMDSLYLAHPEQAQYDAISRAVTGPHILPKDIRFFAAAKPTSSTWTTIGNQIFYKDPK